MNKGARYTVRTRYGVFSLDEASYRDYLAGRHWITWLPQRDDTAAPLRGQEPLPRRLRQRLYVCGIWLT